MQMSMMAESKLIPQHIEVIAVRPASGPPKVCLNRWKPEQNRLSRYQQLRSETSNLSVPPYVAKKGAAS